MKTSDFCVTIVCMMVLIQMTMASTTNWSRIQSYLNSKMEVDDKMKEVLENVIIQWFNEKCSRCFSLLSPHKYWCMNEKLDRKIRMLKTFNCYY